METPDETTLRLEMYNDETRQRLSSIMPYLRLFNSPLPDKAPIFSESEAPTFGTLYTFRGQVKEWSFSVSMNDNYVRLLQKATNSPFLPMSNDEHVLTMELHHDSLIVITVESEATKKVHSIVLDTATPCATFSMEGLLNTLQNTECEKIRDRLTAIPWPKADEAPLTAQTLHQRLSRVLVILLTSQAMQVPRGRPSYNLGGDPSNSALTASISNPGGDRDTPSRAKPRSVRKPTGAEAGSSRKRPRRDTPGGSSGSALTNLSKDSRGPEKDIDYAKAAKTQETFLRHCQQCYPFGVDATYEVNIEQMIVAQDAKHKQDAVVVRACEMKIVQNLMRVLTEMGDINQRQTICLTPCTEEGVLLQEKPQSWDEIKDGMFLIINGQHSVTASKLLQNKEGLWDKRKQEVQTWKAYIVWTLKKNLLVCISEWYNACNHLKHSQSTWGSNILSARSIWISYDRPTSVREGAGSYRNNDAKYDMARFTAFKEAIITRFRNIEKGTRFEVRKLSDIKNEVIIITASDEMFDLWSQFITAHCNGELIDPDTKKKFNDQKRFDYGPKFQLHREFFKRLGNLSEEEYLKLAVHLLNKTPGRLDDWPKVVVHRFKSNLPRTYATEDWVERRKRKKIVIQELHAIKPELCFCDESGSVNKQNWKNWKYDNGVTSASMNILLQIPDKEFFTFRKEKKGWHVRAGMNEKFTNVEAFFKKFLRMKAAFKKPEGSVYLREFNRKSFEFGPRGPFQSIKNLKLGIIDLRDTPGHMDEKDTTSKPYFQHFMQKFTLQHNPGLHDLPAWLMISKTTERNAQIIHYVDQHMRDYILISSTYYVHANERLYHNDQKSRGKHREVFLAFLLKKGSANPKPQTMYVAPHIEYYTEPHKYNERQFSLSDRELRMEFYLDIMELFCTPGDSVYCLFGGTKTMHAANMLSLKYYGIVHQADRKDYMQSLQSYQEIDKNDFRHRTYAVVKSTAGPSQPLRPSTAAISEFDDDEEVIPERNRRQPRQSDEDTEMSEADPSEAGEELQTFDASSQLFLSSRRPQGERVEGTGDLYLGDGRFGRAEQNPGWRRFARPEQNLRDDDFARGEQNRERNPSEESSDESHDSGENEGSQAPVQDSEDSETRAAKAEQRRKGKQAEVGSSRQRTEESDESGGEFPGPEADVAEVGEAPTAEAEPKQQGRTSVADPIVLSDEDDPVPDPEHDKFNLANQVPREVLEVAREKHISTGESSGQTAEELDRELVKVKYESYWEQKSEKRRKKAESEAQHREEMDAVKESVRRAEQVGESLSKSMTGLAQSMQETIQSNNQAMMQAFSQMLQGVGFTPALQSPYSQGRYPPALSFKSPADVMPPAPAIEFTPPATLPGVPTPGFARTEQNQRPEDAAEEEAPPNRTHGGGTGHTFGGSEHNEESRGSEGSPSGDPVQAAHVSLDQATNTAAAGTENVESEKAEVHPDGCHKVETSSRPRTPPDDDGDTASHLKTHLQTEGSAGISAPVPPDSAASVEEQGGEVGEDRGKVSEHSSGGAKSATDHVEEEAVDYEPSPVREKEKEKTPPEDDDDAWSISPARLENQKV